MITSCFSNFMDYFCDVTIEQAFSFGGLGLVLCMCVRVWVNGCKLGIGMRACPYRSLEIGMFVSP